MQSALFGLPIEIYFGESAAIKVAGAEEENSLWGIILGALHREKVAASCLPGCVRTLAFGMRFDLLCRRVHRNRAKEKTGLTLQPLS
jgi:hypothetical protein